MINDRWRTAIHEAGHCVACIALGGECTRLVVHPDATGLAMLGELSQTDNAIATAAAIAAEELLRDVPAPEAPTPESFDIPDDVFGLTPAEKLEHIAAKYPIHKSPSDEHCVAQFCISGLESELPERWVERYYFIHHMAARVVHDHQDAILRVARELFRHRILEKTQIEEVMQCKP